MVSKGKRDLRKRYLRKKKVMVWTIDYNEIKYFYGMKQINLYWPDAATL